MRKHIYLGIGANTNECCILKSPISFDLFEKYRDSIESNDFIHDSTNWGGKDEIKRTLKMRQLELTGRKIALFNPITFHGADYDFGNRYDWDFSVYAIAEASKRSEICPEN